jgi:hypothetical protein
VYSGTCLKEYTLYSFENFGKLNWSEYPWSAKTTSDFAFLRLLSRLLYYKKQRFLHACTLPVLIWKSISLFICFMTSSYTQQLEPNDTILRRSYSKWKGLKGQKSQYFRPSVFFIKQYPLVPWFTWFNAFLNSASNSPIYNWFSEIKIVHVVSLSPYPHKFLLGSPF